MSEVSKAKFTKGDWVGLDNGKWADCGAWSVDNDEASRYSNVAVNVGGVTICLVVSDSWDDEEMEANAHLISAAPDMYQMLERFSKYFDEMCEGDVVDEIGNLLAKARGE